MLVGAGHAHLGVLARADAFARRDAELVVVTPGGTFWYSGLATGMLGGRYAESADVVPVDALIRRGGGRCLAASVTALDPRRRRLTLSTGDTVDYDLCSLDVGSTVACGEIPGAARYGVPVKPIENLARLRRVLLDMRGAGTRAVVVVGAGASGVEVAANVEALARRHALPVRVTVLGRRLLAGVPARARDRVTRALEARGLTLREGADVVAVERGAVRLATGETVPFALLAVATGLAPAPLARSAGLPVDDEGALVTDALLRAGGDARVFGGGDAIAFRGRALARIGVHAVRQAPVLLHNLLATLDGHALRPFVPQRRWLLVMNLGDGTGLATWGPLHWHGRLAWRLKDRIDRRWMAGWHAAARVESRDAAPPP